MRCCVPCSPDETPSAESRSQSPSELSRPGRVDGGVDCGGWATSCAAGGGSAGDGCISCDRAWFANTSETSSSTAITAALRKPAGDRDAGLIGMRSAYPRSRAGERWRVSRIRNSLASPRCRERTSDSKGHSQIHKPGGVLDHKFVRTDSRRQWSELLIHDTSALHHQNIQ